MNTHARVAAAAPVAEPAGPHCTCLEFYDDELKQKGFPYQAASRTSACRFGRAAAVMHIDTVWIDRASWACPKLKKGMPAAPATFASSSSTAIDERA